MQRYFVKDKKAEEFILYDQDKHHIKKVMRNKIGDNIETVYNKKVYLCQIINIEPLKLKILNEYVEDRTGKINLTIAISLVQEQKFDLILQKLTELGVSKIIPVTTDRSIVRLSEEKLLKKYPRWQSILKEASEQSHRIVIPQIEKVMSLKELANVESELKLICSLSDNNRPL